MKTLIRFAHVIDPSQSIDEVTDIGIENGKICYIGDIPRTFQAEKIIEGEGFWLTPGFVDLCCRPQLQHPQGITLYQEAKSAIQSGFTSLCIPPDTSPIIDSTASVLKITQQSDPLLPRLFPVGALTSRLEGEAIADLTALAEAGCIAFSQAQAACNSLKTLRHCYEYAASFSLPVIIQPQDPELAKGGIAHEGKVASELGLLGIPEIAETIAVAEHLLLIEKTGVKAHFTCLSSERAVEQIAQAQAKGLPITADVAMHSLHLTEASLRNFNSNCHLYPPLRTEQDKNGLLRGLKNNTLTAICSDHRPLDSIAKLAPFGDTMPGMSTLDTYLSLGIKLVNEKHLSRLQLIEAMTSGPARIFSLPAGTLAVGSYADLCLIDPTQKWTANDQTLSSKGKNSAFKNITLEGKVVSTFLRGQLAYGRTGL